MSDHEDNVHAPTQNEPSDGVPARPDSMALLLQRIEKLESAFSVNNNNSQPAQAQDQRLEGHPGPSIHSDIAAEADSDIQGEYAAIRDSLQRVKLPPDLRLHDGNKQGIRRPDQAIGTILTKCARYLESTLKLLSRDQVSIDQELSDNIFKVTVAHLRYVQDEYASLLVQGTFDPVTTRMFKAMQRNNSAFSPDQVQILQSAAAISAAAMRPSRDNYNGYQSQQQYGYRRGDFGSRGRTRGRGRGYGYNTGYGNTQWDQRDQDPFNRFASRNIPTSRPGAGDRTQD